MTETMKMPAAFEAELAKRPTDGAGNALCACGAPVDDRLFSCAACAEAHEKERELRYENSLLENNRTGALDALPAWRWTDDDARYHAAVTSPKLRAVAERYTLGAGSLLVRGPTGAGKTASVRRAVARLIRAATSTRDPILRVRWTTAPAIVGARLTQRFGDGEADLIRKVRAARVLVLDEFGFERPDPAFWVDLIDERYSRGLVTITTTGATLDELRAKYGAGTIRKLIEPVGSIVEA
ncbi:MAG: ATP-binding protein [Myxococcales bacterium]|nr:ATP-binding protein [Myxococcales bacterium]